MKLFQRYIGSVARTKADDRAYYLYKQTRKGICDFCHIDTSASTIVEDHPLFMITTNAFPYSVWDGGGVIDHIMLVPKRHVETVANFTPEENTEFLHLLSAYDKKGYSSYGRAAGSRYKSIPHQHTHLLKIGTPIRRHIFNFRPYINYFK